MKQTILFLLISVTLFSCCKKENQQPHDLCAEPAIVNSTCVTDTNQIKTAIIGKWDWTQSINSWTQAKTNPCTDSINRAYQFFSNGNVDYFENGAYIASGTYSFTSSQGLVIHALNPTLNFSLSGWVSICANYLIVDDSPVDGPKETFVKTP